MDSPASIVRRHDKRLPLAQICAEEVAAVGQTHHFRDREPIAWLRSSHRFVKVNGALVLLRAVPLQRLRCSVPHESSRLNSSSNLSRLTFKVNLEDFFGGENFMERM